MTYRKYLNVASGTKQQLEACVNAIEVHSDHPEGVLDLLSALREGIDLCDAIVKEGEAEPEEEAAAADESAEA